MTELLALSAGAGLMIVVGGLFAAYVGRGFGDGGILTGAAGGSMLALALVELLPRSLEQVGLLTTIVGVAAGIGLFFIFHDSSHVHHPHQHEHKRNQGHANGILDLSVPLALGVSLHNVLEGVGMGAIYHADPALAWVVAGAVAVHNLPLGFALASRQRRGSIKSIIPTAAFLASFQPLGAVTGALASVYSSPIYALALSASCGLLFGVAALELLPQSLRAGRPRAVVGVLVGLATVYGLHLFHGHH